MRKAVDQPKVHKIHLAKHRDIHLAISTHGRETYIERIGPSSHAHSTTRLLPIEVRELHDALRLRLEDLKVSVTPEVPFPPNIIDPTRALRRRRPQHKDQAELRYTVVKTDFPGLYRLARALNEGATSASYVDAAGQAYDAHLNRVPDFDVENVPAAPENVIVGYGAGAQVWVFGAAA